jgi:hypothetical protein
MKKNAVVKNDMWILSLSVLPPVKCLSYSQPIQKRLDRIVIFITFYAHRVKTELHSRHLTPGNTNNPMCTNSAQVNGENALLF